MEKASYAYNLTTPVVFMVFNRPAKTRRVFDAIKMARPTKLMVIADGPRNSEDEDKCRQVREIINTGIDWPCEVLKNYSDKNLGAKLRISSGLDWVFSQVEEAIILEDDCLPDQSFFPFCQELLKKYHNDTRIMQIGGCNSAVLDKKFTCKDSYYFSNIGLILGWATWRRAWQHYDINISRWPEIKKIGFLYKVLENGAIVNHYEHLFNQYYRHEVKSWDGQWFFARWLNGGYSIVSSNNLIRNIGFDNEGQGHSTDPNDPRAHIPVTPVTFPLIHPKEFKINEGADRFIFKDILAINKFWGQKVRWFIKSNFPSLHLALKKFRQSLKSR